MKRKQTKKYLIESFSERSRNSDEILKRFFPRVPHRVYFSEQILKLTKEII